MMWPPAGEETGVSLMPYSPTGCHSEKSKVEGPAAGEWASPINPNSLMVFAGEALGPCFPEHIPFLLRYPQNSRLHEMSFHWGIQRNT